MWVTTSGEGSNYGSTVDLAAPGSSIYSKGYKMADVNFDGQVTAADARLVLRFSSQLESFSLLQRALADVNYDDVVTSAE